MQFYSTRAYEFVRKTLLNSLPHVATIRKWFSNIEGRPGFSSLSLKLLEAKVTKQREKDAEVLVAVMLDDMALRKEVEFDVSDSQFKGFVDIGNGPSEQSSIPARDVLVIMVVGINSHFKLPIGYFFIAGLSGSERANLVNIALEKIHETGARAAM